MKDRKRSPPFNERVSTLNGVAREKRCFAFKTRPNGTRREEGSISRNRNKEILPELFHDSSFYLRTSTTPIVLRLGERRHRSTGRLFKWLEIISKNLPTNSHVVVSSKYIVTLIQCPFSFSFSLSFFFFFVNCIRKNISNIIFHIANYRDLIL